MRKDQQNWYKTLGRLVSNHCFFLNHGYLEPQGRPELNWVKEQHRAFAPSLNLARKLTDAIELKEASVVELGCGRGGNLMYLQQYRGSRRQIGLDVVLENLVVAKIAASRTTAVLFDGYSFPLRPHHFHLALCVEVLHLVPTPALALKRLWNLLRAGGHLVVADGVRAQSDLPLGEVLAQSGARLRASGDLTEGVIRSLRERKSRMPSEFLPYEERRASIIQRTFVEELVEVVYGYVLPRLEAGVFAYKFSVVEKCDGA